MPSSDTPLPRATTASAEQFLAMRASMLRVSIGGWAWSQKLTIRSGSKLIERLSVARDAASPHYGYTFEEPYAVRLTPITGSAIRTIKVITSRDSSVLTAMTPAWGCTTFTIQRLDQTELTLIDQLPRTRWWQSGFRSTSSGDLQLAAGNVYISHSLPISYGIALALYAVCWG